MFPSKKRKRDTEMSKNVIAHEQEIQKRVDRVYATRGYKPNGFGDSMWGYKFGILSEMYEMEEELGDMPRERIIAYAHIAELYKTMEGWN